MPTAGPKITSTVKSSVTLANRCSSRAGTKATDPGDSSADPDGVTSVARPVVQT